MCGFHHEGGDEDKDVRPKPSKALTWSSGVEARV